MKIGDLALIYRRHAAKGYDTFPGVYGYHKSKVITGEMLGLVLGKRGVFLKVYIDENVLWIHKDDISLTELCKSRDDDDRLGL